jgi:hypothetical protein
VLRFRGKGKYNRLSLDKAEMVNWTFENEKLDCRHRCGRSLAPQQFGDGQGVYTRKALLKVELLRGKGLPAKLYTRYHK